MLSFQKGIPVAVILGGAQNKKVVKIYQEKRDDEYKLIKVLESDYENSDSEEERVKIKKKGKGGKTIKKISKEESESEFESEDSELEYCSKACMKNNGCSRCIPKVYKGGAMSDDEEDEGDVRDVYNGSDIEDEEKLSYNPMTLIPKSTFKGINYNARDLVMLKEFLINKRKPTNRTLNKMYVKAKDILDQKKDIILTDGQFYPVPIVVSKQRNMLWIAGAAGSGKSAYSASWAKFWKKMNPGRPIYLISAKEHDELMDKVGVTRVRIDKEFMDDLPKAVELKKSLLIFDDCDNIGVGMKIETEIEVRDTENKDKSEKKKKKIKFVKTSEIKKKVQEFRDLMLETGRSYGIDMIVTGHQMTNYKDTRHILAEASNIVFFPEKNSTAGIQYWMTKYGGFSRDEQQKILSIPSRWINIYVGGELPPHIISQTQIFLLSTIKDKIKKKKSKS